MAGVCAPAGDAAALRDAQSDAGRRRSIRCFATCSRAKERPHDASSKHARILRRRRKASRPAGATRSDCGRSASLPQAPLPAGPRAEQPLPDPSDWTFELIEQYHEKIRAAAQRFALDTYPNQLEVITAEQMMDAYASVGMPVNYRHWSYGKEFIANEKQLPARPDGPGLRDRHQLRSLHQLPDGGEHDGDAGARDRPCGLRPQQLLQGQLPVPPLDRRVVDHRLPRLRPELHRRVRGEARHAGGRGPARLLPRAAELRRRPLQAAEQAVARRGAGAPQRAARVYAVAGQRHLAHAPRQAERPGETDEQTLPSEPQENLLYFIEKTRRCWSRGSARSSASCARSPSTSIRSARPRS